MKKLLALLLILSTVVCSACTFSSKPVVQIDNLPEYTDRPSVEINNNIPNFTDKEKQNTKTFEKYSRQDALGRCGTAFANLAPELMPTKPRGSISSVKPTGWVQNEYVFIEDGHLYNRCHLIAHSLAGEDDNKRNLITGTRYMNTKGMLPYETKVLDYIRSTSNHVLYRVTPHFKEKNLLADGVQMEAWSVEDNGEGICFNVYCFNVQPGVMITYANGQNRADGTIKVYGNSKTSGNKKSTITAGKKSASQKESGTYILNTSRLKFHKPSCNSVKTMNPDNKEKFTGKRSELIAKGYEPCGNCKP